MPEKYIHIKKDGKPEYIARPGDNTTQGWPADADMCHIEFKAVPVTRAVPVDDDPDHKDQKKEVELDGYNFNCIRSDECAKKHKETDDKRKKLRDDIKPLAENKHRTKEQTERLTALRKELAQMKPDCELTFMVGDGGDKAPSGQLTIEEIKAKKIEYAFCFCDPPKKGK